MGGDASLVIGAEYIGHGGSGVFAQQAGINDVNGDLVIGYATGSAGTYTLGGGTLSILGGTEYVGLRGRGTVIQTGGAHTVGNSGGGGGGIVIGYPPPAAPAHLYVGFYSGSTGVYTPSRG